MMMSFTAIEKVSSLVLDALGLREGVQIRKLGSWARERDMRPGF